jgi:uncharacterized protein YdeI (YjbR/CyaY-like superfamily)
MKRTDSVRHSRVPAIAGGSIVIPKDLRAALSRHPALDSLFSSLPDSHQREYVNWITGAKRPETRKARIEKTLRMLAAKRPAKGR